MVGGAVRGGLPTDAGIGIAFAEDDGDFVSQSGKPGGGAGEEDAGRAGGGDGHGSGSGGKGGGTLNGWEDRGGTDWSEAHAVFG